MTSNNERHLKVTVLYNERINYPKNGNSRAKSARHSTEMSKDCAGMGYSMAPMFGPGPEMLASQIFWTIFWMQSSYLDKSTGYSIRMPDHELILQLLAVFHVGDLKPGVEL